MRADADADRLARLLSGIDDLEQRAHKAASLLAAMPGHLAARALGELVRGSARGKVEHGAAVEAAQRAVHAVIDDTLHADLLSAASEARDEEAVSLLSRRPAARSYDQGEPGYVDREMTARTLGERKQFARGRNSFLLARLAHDQDPSVVRQLLENPRVTEREALVIASRRPTHAAVLEEVFRSRRFGNNRRVRKALALNPYAPAGLAIAALSLLTKPELREVANDSHLSEPVRAHATRLLALRAGD